MENERFILLQIRTATNTELPVQKGLAKFLTEQAHADPPILARHLADHDTELRRPARPIDFAEMSEAHEDTIGQIRRRCNAPAQRCRNASPLSLRFAAGSVVVIESFGQTFT